MDTAEIQEMFQYISNKMQCYTVCCILKLLYMFRVVPSPTISNVNNCIYSIWYLSHRYCYLPLSWKSWNRSECAVGGVRHCFFVFNLHGSVHRNNILIYIQQDATLHSLRVFYLETALDISGNTISYHQERKQLYLQHLVSRRYCSLLLSWNSWNWFECAVGGVRHATHSTLRPVPTLPR